MSSNPTPRTVTQLRTEIESNKSIFHAQAMQTPQTNFISSALISATATRVNGRIAMVPRAGDEAQTTLAVKASTPLKMSYPAGRRLPMNMVVSQIARRRCSSLVRETTQRVQAAETPPPPLDPFLERLLNFKAPGSKKGSLPHPDDLMGAKTRKFRKVDGPEDEIHKAFMAVYGGEEASLAVTKRLRLNKGLENEDPLADTPRCSESSSSLAALAYGNEVQQKHRSPDLNKSEASDTNSHFLELYGGVSQQSWAQPRRSVSHETWEALGSSPPRKFVSSSSFLRTAYEAKDRHHAIFENITSSISSPPQESPWKKYLTKEGDKGDDDSSWVIKSLGNSNRDHHYNSGTQLWKNDNNTSDTSNYYATDTHFKPRFVTKDYKSEDELYGREFNFIPSPALPESSPVLAHDSRMLRGDAAVRQTRQEESTAGLPESAQCRWLYETSPHRNEDEVQHTSHPEPPYHTGASALIRQVRGKEARRRSEHTESIYETRTQASSRQTRDNQPDPPYMSYARDETCRSSSRYSEQVPYGSVAPSRQGCGNEAWLTGKHSEPSYASYDGEKTRWCNSKYPEQATFKAQVLSRQTPREDDEAQSRYSESADVTRGPVSGRRGGAEEREDDVGIANFMLADRESLYFTENGEGDDSSSW